MTESSRPLYLDHNATTPVDPRVLAAMLPYFTEAFGNPSSVEHLHGHEAQAVVEKSRIRVATAIGARENEIVFTGSCTEANNIAILGAALAHPEKKHLVTTAIEHPSVLGPCEHLATQGYELTVLGVDGYGRVSPDEVRAALREDTALVSVMGANNEVGSVQPLAEIGAVCAERGVLFHADLAQVVAHRPVNVGRENIHLASLSGHKAYGPKGIGALYVRSRSPRARLAPITYGGGQERALRPGTLNVPLVVGLGKAIEIATMEAAQECRRLDDMTTAFRNHLSERVSGIHFNGHPTDRLPNNVSISIEGVEPLILMRRLNSMASFSASSACATDKVQTSHVLLAMFGDTPRARQAFRVSPGRSTTAEQFLAFADELVTTVADLRRFAA